MKTTELLQINLRLFDTQVTTQASLSAEMKTYYNDRLIDNAEPKLVHDQFGSKYPIPRNGGKIIEFRKYSPLPKALTALAEGLAPAGNSLTVSTVTATVDQYGDFIKLSDMLEMTAIDRNVEEATKLLGAQAGRTLDTITRDVITGGSNVIYAPSVASNGTETEINLRENIDANCLLTFDVMNTAAAKLERMNANPIDDAFVAIVHTDIARDLLMSDGFLEAHKYATPENIYSGEIGMYGNIRYVKSSEAKIIGPEDMLGISGYNRTTINANVSSSTDVYPATPFTVAQAAVINAAISAGTVYKLYVDETERTVASVVGGAAGTCKIVLTEAVSESAGDPICGIGAGKDGTAVYCTMLIGANAYGVTEVQGMGLEHIVKQLGYGEDPLNQRSSVGWKATKVAERLVEEYMIRVEHTSKKFAQEAVSN